MKYCILNIENYKENYSENISEFSPLEVGIPLFDCEDKTIGEIYYYRWYVFCKHIRKTPDGYVITEFYPHVPWSQKYNAINCPAGHHLYEGRWLHNSEYLKSYINFWFRDKDANPRHYSFWAANSVYNVCSATGDFSLAEELYNDLKENYFKWEESHLKENGLFYQRDGYDGMEFSASGSGLRPTINSYMYGDAVALSKLAKRLSKYDDEKLFCDKANELKKKIDDMLWNSSQEFYEALSEDKDYNFSGVREQMGYVPWYFNLPDEDKSVAWKFLMDEKYFYAPYGPTTTEQTYPDFMKEFEHECLWNGPSWPFATSQTLTALKNLLCDYNQNIITKSDYCNLLHIYAKSQYDVDEDGKKIPYIDENLDPFTGEWIARSKLRKMKNPPGGADRGADYNHSTFCDLVISGLAGLRVRDDDVLEIEPLFSENDMKYLCLDGILYHGKYITILWDKDGTRYNKGKGLRIYSDGKEIYSSSTLKKVRYENLSFA